MDLAKTATIIGIVAAVLYVFETLCKYGVALFKKVPRATTSAFKKIFIKRSRPISTRGTSFAARFVLDSFAKTTKTRPTYDVDIVAAHGSTLLKNPNFGYRER